MQQRVIAAVTVGRSDYSLYRPIFQEIENRPDLYLSVMVSGTHLTTEFGLTIEDIEADGFAVDEKVQTVLPEDSAGMVAKSMRLGIMGFGQVFVRRRPDILLVIGDRFEMHSAVVAAVPFQIPIAHIHGGEVTYGAFDEGFRHSISKFSHLHFASTEGHARRLRQLGEEPWRITVSGAPGLDNIRQTKRLPRDEFFTRFNLRPVDDFLLVTYHPVTHELESLVCQFEELIAALNDSGREIILTMPNNDPGGRALRVLIADFADEHPRVQVVENFGSQGYASAMSLASAMVGNSSSGIIEAATFELPVVNIGSRQEGRSRGPNVIDCDYNRSEITAALRQATDPEFRSSFARLPNPYGDGYAAKRIVDRLSTETLDERLLVKRFCDLP